MSTVTTLTSRDESAAVATILVAFANDPVARWSLPDARRYVEYFPRIIRAFGGRAFACGGAIGIDSIAGAALWLAPGVHPDDEAMGAVVQEALSPAELEKVGPFMTQMEQYHPKEPCWYLPLIGVDPTRRGKGLGSQLIAEICTRCDRDGVLAYLEATSPRSVPLYERHGFEMVGQIQAGDSPVMTPMLRKPR
jgi:GNAT superfamily N-acetyltransferase